MMKQAWRLLCACVLATAPSVGSLTLGAPSAKLFVAPTRQTSQRRTVWTMRVKSGPKGDGGMLKGNSIFASDAARKKSLIDPNKVFLGNLNWNVTASELKTMCRRFGDVAHVKVVKNHYTGNSKGIAFVRFCDPISATAALTTLHGQELYGRLIVCDNVEEKPKLTKKQRKLADKIAGWEAAKVAGEGGFDIVNALSAGAEQEGGEDLVEDDDEEEENDLGGEESGGEVVNE